MVVSILNREICVCASRLNQHGGKAFKMSLVLEKVSKVLSCEIRAQAKEGLHVL